MSARVIFLLSVALLTTSCGGGDKHLPSSNPPEYDPSKVYAAPTAPSRPATLSTAPTELESLRSKLDSLEMSSTEKGERKKLPFDSNSLQPFKGAANPCEILSRLAPGLGSAQLFAGHEGAALKKALGADADDIARRMDEQLAEGLKHSLGPGAADCPISARPRKSSGQIDRFHPARVVLAHAPPTQPFLLAQNTMPDTSQDDYDVNKPPIRRENAPPDWVGYKTTETLTRIGRKPHTNGIREQYEMVIAPKAKRCPHLEGPDLEGRVEGTFEWSLLLYRSAPGPDGATQGVLYRRHVVAELKGKVGDDAKVQYVDFDVRITLQHIGTELPYYSHSARLNGQFTIDQRMMGVPEEFKVIEVSDFSAGEAEEKDASLMASLTLIVAYFSGLTYFEAQTEWNTPNTCVEMTFTPATKTYKLDPTESVSVKTELRTKKDLAIVPAKFKEAKERPRERNGTVSPRETESQLGMPATFTYQAPANRVKHSGFWVAAVSRAGVAQAKDGEWEVADTSYVLEFQSRIVSTEPTEPVESVAAGKVLLTPAEGKEGWYRGSGMLGYQTGPPANRDLCTTLVMGHGTTRFDVEGMSIKLSEKTDSVSHRTGSADIELHYLIHPTNETERPVTYVNFECVPGKPLPYPFFYSIYAVARGGDEVNLLKGWTYVGKNGVVATKVLRGNCGDYCEDQTIFTLKEVDDQASPTK